jgi:sugar phosphate isomerase/epimerase
MWQPLLLIGEWALPSEGSLGSRLEAATAAGFDGVELVWCDSGSILAESSLPSVAKELRHGSVEIASLCTEPLSPAGNGLGTFVGSIAKMVQTAAFLGAGVVVVNPGRLDHESTCKVVELACLVAARVDVAIAIENGIRGDLVTTPKSLSRLAELGSIEVNLDVGNATATENLDAWLSQDYRPLRSLHLKDWSLASDSPLVCGDGDVQWEAVKKALDGRLPPIMTVEHSRRAFGTRALQADLATRIRTWAATGHIERATE